jgi:hypothetical protein
VFGAICEPLLFQLALGAYPALRRLRRSHGEYW